MVEYLEEEGVRVHQKAADTDVLVTKGCYACHFGKVCAVHQLRFRTLRKIHQPTKIRCLIRAAISAADDHAVEVDVGTTERAINRTQKDTLQT